MSTLPDPSDPVEIIRAQAQHVLRPPAGRPVGEFNPLYLVELVEGILREHGIPMPKNPPVSSTATAMIAAADLLRALGVTPASSPRRPQ